MCALPQRSTWTKEDYLAFEREQTDAKHELIDGEIYAMAGGSREHILITGASYSSLFVQTADRPCEVYQSEMKVYNRATGSFMYPDIAITCGEVEMDDNRRDILLNPTMIIEVLSPSTADYDRGTKFNHYQMIPSLREYVLIEQDKPEAEQRTRQSGEFTQQPCIIGLAGALFG
ncbi:MAG: Uma2 family endonuclease, partial [Chloroflexota bacterium]